MGLRTSDFDKDSLVYGMFASQVIIPAISGNSPAVLVAAAVPVNATPMTLLNGGYTTFPHALALTQTLATTVAGTLRITGIDQFGDVRSEVVTFAGGISTSELQFTLWAYQQVTEVLPLTGIWGAGTVSVGLQANDGTKRQPIGLPFRVEHEWDIAFVALGSLFLIQDLVPPLTNVCGVDVVHNTVFVPQHTTFGSTASSEYIIRFTDAARAKY